MEVTNHIIKAFRKGDILPFFSEPQVFSGHTAFIKNAVFSHDGKQIISAADDKTLRFVTESFAPSI